MKENFTNEQKEKIRKWAIEIDLFLTSPAVESSGFVVCEPNRQALTDYLNETFGGEISYPGLCIAFRELVKAGKLQLKPEPKPTLVERVPIVVRETNNAQRRFRNGRLV
jgi:hypothetical protein